MDTDGDGTGDDADIDDDGDLVLDVFDDVPTDRSVRSDLDGDGVDDAIDDDDDGDGVVDTMDRFPADSSEWLDTDGDLVGNNQDQDDDNDGIPDVSDEEPLVGIREPGLLDLVLGALATRVYENLVVGRAYDPLVWHEAQPADVTYPEGRGTRQRFAQVMLGDVASFSAQLMLDEFELPAVAERCGECLLRPQCKLRPHRRRATVQNCSGTSTILDDPLLPKEVTLVQCAICVGSNSRLSSRLVRNPTVEEPLARHRIHQRDFRGFR